MRRAIFPGTFDPFTLGHADIVQRGLRLFDEVIIGIGSNCTKHNQQSADERQAAIEHLYADEPRVRVLVYDCLTIDFARQQQADCIIRGVRSTIDFEYERTIAEANQQLSGIETILLPARPELAHLSSTLVRDLQSYGKDITPFLPHIESDLASVSSPSRSM